MASFKDKCNEERAGIEILKTHVLALMEFEGQNVKHPMDFGEMKANIMLSYRHLEDARMRLGKAIQASEGGVSIYDKEPES